MAGHEVALEDVVRGAEYVERGQASVVTGLSAVSEKQSTK